MVQVHSWNLRDSRFHPWFSSNNKITISTLLTIKTKNYEQEH